jgi:predicted nucleotidyltransferase
MNPVITEKLGELAELCSRYRVSRLELFGSGAGARFDPEKSDLDFLVEYNPLNPGEHAEAYFGLKESLQDLFGRPVDIVMTRAIRNPYFLQGIEQSRVLLYAA